MPRLSASLLSTVLPAILSLLAMVALISYTCIYWSRWEDIKSFYYDSFNRTEIPILLVFFGLIFLSSVAAYLHAYIGLTYTFGAFVILNTLEVCSVQQVWQVIFRGLCHNYIEAVLLYHRESMH